MKIEVTNQNLINPSKIVCLDVYYMDILINNVKFVAELHGCFGGFLIPTVYLHAKDKTADLLLSVNEKIIDKEEVSIKLKTFIMQSIKQCLDTKLPDVKFNLEMCSYENTLFPTSSISYKFVYNDIVAADGTLYFRNKYIEVETVFKGIGKNASKRKIGKAQTINGVVRIIRRHINQLKKIFEELKEVINLSNEILNKFSFEKKIDTVIDFEDENVVLSNENMAITIDKTLTSKVALKNVSKEELYKLLSMKNKCEVL